MRRLLRPLVLVTLLAGAAACGRKTPAAAEAPAPALRPLEALAGQPVVVVPAQRLRTGDSLGWAAKAGAPRAYLAQLDDELAFAVRERGTASAWAFGPDVARAARRSPTVAGDPYALAVDPLLGEKPREDLGAGLVSQLRSIVAISGARYAVVPAELRFVRRADGQGEAVLRVVLVDTRGSRRVWAVDVRSDPAPGFTRGLLASLAGHFADLIAAPAGADGA